MAKKLKLHSVALGLEVEPTNNPVNTTNYVINNSGYLMAVCYEQPFESTPFESATLFEQIVDTFNHGGVSALNKSGYPEAYVLTLPGFDKMIVIPTGEPDVDKDEDAVNRSIKDTFDYTPTPIFKSSLLLLCKGEKCD